jgi:MFS transporter, DHA2 family, methylenomycin A resistance protein
VEARLVCVVAACGGFFLITLDASVVNVALPAMATTLHAGLTELQWVVDAYTVALAGMIVLAGVAADRLGAGRVFRWGSVGFAMTSLVCAAAPDAGTLVLARVAQGIAGGVMLPSSMAVVTQVWPDSARRTRALGWWAAGGGVAVAAGPVVGGALTELAGWRSVFVLSVPVAALAALVSRGDRRGQRAGATDPLDPLGQLLLVVALVGGIAAMIEFSRWGAQPAMVVGGVAVCLLSSGWLVRRARRGSPALPLDQLRRAGVAQAVTAGALLNLSFFGVVFALGLALQREQRLSPVVTGLVLLPASIVIPLANLAAGIGIRRWGPRGSLVRGLLLEGAGFLLVAVALLSPREGVVLVTAALLPVGAGAGWASPAMMALLMDAVAPGREGQMAGFLNGARQAASAIGVAAAGLTIAVSPTLTTGAALVCATAGLSLALASLGCRVPAPHLGPPNHRERSKGPTAATPDSF